MPAMTVIISVDLDQMTCTDFFSLYDILADLEEIKPDSPELEIQRSVLPFNTVSNRNIIQYVFVFFGFVFHRGRILQ